MYVKNIYGSFRVSKTVYGSLRQQSILSYYASDSNSIDPTCASRSNWFVRIDDEEGQVSKDGYGVSPAKSG